MKFLFVHEVNWREKVIFEIHDIPELLSLAGHEVTFIDFPEFASTDPRNGRFGFRTEMALRQSRAHAGSAVDVLTPGGIVPGYFRRFLATFTFAPLFWRTVKHRKIDLVVLYGVPTNGWQTVLLAKILRVPVLFRAIDIAHLLRATRFKPFVKVAERYIYRNSDHISSHNSALKNYCVEMGAASDKVSVDYPRLDLELFKPGTRNETLAQSLGIRPMQKVVLFRGTLYRFAGIEKFIQLFFEYLSKNSDVCLLIVGNGEAESSINKTISDLGLKEQVITTPFVDYRHLVDHIRLADVSINTFVPSLVTDCVLPGRVLQSMACGIPVVSTRLSGMVDYSSQSEAVTYRNLDESFAQAVADLLENPALHDKKAKAGRDLVVSRGTWSEFVGDFTRMCESLVANK